MSPFAKSNRQIFPGKNFFQRIKLFVWIFLFQKFERKKMSLPKSTCRQCFEAGLQQAVGQSEEEKTLLHLVYFDNYILNVSGIRTGSRLGEVHNYWVTNDCLESELLCNLSKLQKLNFPQFDSLSICQLVNLVACGLVSFSACASWSLRAWFNKQSFKCCLPGR